MLHLKIVIICRDVKAYLVLFYCLYPTILLTNPYIQLTNPENKVQYSDIIMIYPGTAEQCNYA